MRKIVTQLQIKHYLDKNNKLNDKYLVKDSFGNKTVFYKNDPRYKLFSSFDSSRVTKYNMDDKLSCGEFDQAFETELEEANFIKKDVILSQLAATSTQPHFWNIKNHYSYVELDCDSSGEFFLFDFNSNVSLENTKIRIAPNAELEIRSIARDAQTFDNKMFLNYSPKDDKLNLILARHNAGQVGDDIVFSIEIEEVFLRNGLTQDDIDSYVHNKDRDVRLAAVRMGIGLEVFVNDPDASIRLEVAMQGYGLDKLVKDPDPTVRIAVAEKGYGLDKLINDENEYVRHEANRAMNNKH